MSEPARQQDPSMEEILNSIRRIVAEDAKQRGKRTEAQRAAPQGDRAAVLELTEVVTADGTVFSIADHQHNRLEAIRPGDNPQPRVAAAVLAQEAWTVMNAVWTRVQGLEGDLRATQLESAAAGRDVLDRLAREQDGLTRRLALVAAVRDAVLAGARLITATGEMVARDVGLPSCDLTAVAPATSLHAPTGDATLDTARLAWERVEAARTALMAAEQRLAGAEKAWASRRSGAIGSAPGADPLNLLEAEHEHLLARSAVVAAQREEIVAAHSLALEVHRLAERGVPALS
jgi:hypothetical protein